MTDPTASPAEVFLQLRGQLFRDDLASLAPPDDGAPTPEAGPEIIGVCMEVGLETASYLVYGLRDGSASLYISTGGSIGGQGQPHINAAARKFVAAARHFVTQLPSVNEYPIPATGRVRFSIFTTTGVFAGETDETELMNGRGELLPLFETAHVIIAGFRQIQEPEPPNESKYLNYLLVALARGTGKSVTMTDGETLPDPAPLTANLEDLKDIAKIGFKFKQLSTTAIIRTLLHMAGYRWFRFFKTQGYFPVRLLGNDGESFTLVTFRVSRLRQAGRNQIEISVHNAD